MRCISCNNDNNQAGHYFPTRFSSVRFNEINVNGQCAGCNLYKWGAPHEYRKGLIERYGLRAVEELETEALRNPIKKWSRQELEEIIIKYKSAVDN